MAFEKHLFISYAHLDNLPLTDRQQGWVTKFHSSLSAMLTMRLGRKAEIWRDSKLAGNDIFADEIIQQFPTTALVISVVTPHYVESEWCTREAREFCRQAEHHGGLLVDNKSRILKVIKIPVEREDSLPEVMKLSLGYPFYVLDDQQMPIELDSAYGEEYAQKYNLKLAKLAFDIAQLVKRMEQTSEPQSRAVPNASVKPSVYLAECSYDRREARESVESELKLHGYEVLPNARLPIEEEAYVAEVQKLLARCQLSIHLVGEKYGVVPDGPSDKSVVILQNELAIARCRQAPLRRLIWLPEGTRSDSMLQQQFIDGLLNQANQQTGADLISGDLLSLKSAIHAVLKKIEAAAEAANVRPRPSVRASEPKQIYILCTESDRKATIPLRKYFKQHGVESHIPLFEGDAATVRQAHTDMLAQCDGLILFYGTGDEAWKWSVDSDLRKLAAYRSERPLPVRRTYLADPSTSDKTDLIDLEEPNLINGLVTFSESLLDPFLTDLARGGSQ